MAAWRGVDRDGTDCKLIAEIVSINGTATINAVVLVQDKIVFEWTIGSVKHVALCGREIPDQGSCFG